MPTPESNPTSPLPSAEIQRDRKLEAKLEEMDAHEYESAEKRLSEWSERNANGMDVVEYRHMLFTFKSHVERVAKFWKFIDAEQDPAKRKTLMKRVEKVVKFKIPTKEVSVDVFDKLVIKMDLGMFDVLHREVDEAMKQGQMDNARRLIGDITKSSSEVFSSLQNEGLVGNYGKIMVRTKGLDMQTERLYARMDMGPAEELEYMLIKEKMDGILQQVEQSLSMARSWLGSQDRSSPFLALTGMANMATSGILLGVVGKISSESQRVNMAIGGGMSTRMRAIQLEHIELETKVLVKTVSALDIETLEKALTPGSKMEIGMPLETLVELVLYTRNGVMRNANALERRGVDITSFNRKLGRIIEALVRKQQGKIA